jgi:hypothetical protein
MSSDVRSELVKISDTARVYAPNIGFSGYRTYFVDEITQLLRK